MLKKLMHAAAALALVAGIVASTAQPAEAHRRGVGAGLAIGTIIGLGIAGAYAGRSRGYHDEGACYRGPRQCERVGRRCWFNSYGERVCRGGEYRCWRPTYCD
jgi:hypothetical protein